MDEDEDPLKKLKYNLEKARFLTSMDPGHPKREMIRGIIEITEEHFEISVTLAELKESLQEEDLSDLADIYQYLLGEVYGHDVINAALALHYLADELED